MRQNQDFRNFYEIIKKIGDGLGTVYRAKKKDSDEERAIKVIDKKLINLDNYYFKSLIKNMNISKGEKKENENIVKFYEYFDTKDEFAIVMELCDENLLIFLSKRTEKIPPKEINDILIQLNNIFKIIAKNKIVLINLILEKILLKYDSKENNVYKVKLKLSNWSSLFKLKEIISLGKYKYRIRFIAPEILKGDKPNEKTDLWSLGVIIYVLAFKEYPYTGENEEVLLNKIENNGQNNFKKTGNSNLDNLIQKLLVEKPSQRLGWEEYFNHSFFKRDFSEIYEIVRKIDGEGNGDIYEAKVKNSGELVAIKKFDKNKKINEFIQQNIREPTEEEMKSYNDNFYREMKNMKLIEGKNAKNENAIKVYEYFDNKDEFIIVMELCDCNLLNVFIERKEFFNTEQIYNLLTQLNNNFKIMANDKIISRELNLNNILLKFKNEEKTKYIAKIKLTKNSCLFNELTTIELFRKPKFMAPEILKGENCKENSDLWSLGVIIYVLLFKKYPYNSNNEITILKEIEQNQQNNFQKADNKNLDDLIRKLLVEDPSKRITWKEYFKHPFFYRDESKSKIKILNEDFRKYYTLSLKKGNGTFGVVYSAIKNNTKEKRAIKIFDKELIRNSIRNEQFREPTEEEMKTYTNGLINEIENMITVQSQTTEIENKNTAKFYECFDTKNEFAIVMELCDISLTDFIAKKDDKFNVGEIKEILIQLNNSFKIMVQNRLVHRDLKLQNILVKYEDNNYVTFKLTDYGLSKKLLTISKRFSSLAGTSIYMAPEILKSQKYNDECDLWSLGVIIYILCFKVYPYKGGSDIEILKQIKELKKSLNKTGNDDLDNLISRLLIEEPKERITWKEYFNHPFFTNSIKPISILNKVTNEENKKLDTKKDNNYILIKIKIGEKNINKDIYFLEKDNNEHSHLNIFNDSNCKLYINNEKTNFKKYFNPTIAGEYQIKIIFTCTIDNCSYMFNQCKNIIDLDLSNFYSSNVIDMNHMFSECFNLKNINLSNFNTENVTNMSYLFNNCYEIKELDFPQSFNTQNVKNFSYMFHNCQNISQINFSSYFKTNNSTSMRTMFGKCYKLQKLDLQNFDTKEVKDMSYMFEQCINLEEILFSSSFKTNQTTYMNYMFSECNSLKKLDLSSFSAENAKFMSYMFNNCKQMTNIDLSKCKINKDTNMIYMFNDCTNLRELNISSFIISDTNKIDDMFENMKNIQKIIVNRQSKGILQNKFMKIQNKFSI